MVAFSRLPALSPLVPPVAGAVTGVGVAALFALLPATVLEDWVWASGLPALLAAAAPPLGITARIVLALAGGAMAASVMWSLLYLLFGPGGLLAPRTPANAVPVVRRADAHRDAPPRRPMTAADLGTPLMEVSAPIAPPIEQPVPKDLDQPLAAFDPAAIPDVPLPAPEKIVPLARIIDITFAPEPEPTPTPTEIVAPARQALAPGERIDTYVLTPPPPTMPASAMREQAPRPSIEALLRRLEEVTAQRVAMGR